MKLFISPAEESKKIVDAIDFADRIKLQWPQVIMSSIIDPMRDFILEWEINIGERYLTGKLDRVEDMIVFEFSDIDFGAYFSIWAYHNLLTQDNIILYDENYDNVFNLKITSISSEIIKVFS